MVLTGKAYQRLQKALVSAYGDYAPLEIFVDFNLQAKLREICPPTVTIDVVVFELIGWANARGRIAALVTAAIEDVPGNELLAEFFLEFTELRADLPDDPLTICWFPHKKPFVNRVRLRQALRELKNVPTRRGLVVLGDPRTGKSYSKDLIDYLQTETGEFEAIYIDLSRREKFQANEIVSRLIIQMGQPMPLLPVLASADSARLWAADLALLVYGAARASNKRWWLILDEFRKAALQPGVLELAEELADLISIGDPPLRLVLVNYTGTIPGSVKGRFDYEEVTPLSRTDVRDFFKQFFDLHGGADDATIDDVTAAVWNPAASLDSVEAITLRIEQKVLDLLQARAQGVA